MTPEQLIELGAVALSLLFAFVPGFKSLFDNLGDVYKRLVMAGLLLVVVAGAYVMSCYGLLTYFECGWAGVFAALAILLKAILVNQGTYQVVHKWFKLV